MTERKVLNKYFPPDFDPAKIPRLKGMKKEKVFSIRTMAPFNMMCLTCRGYIFKAKKFNSRMEECEYTYLDLKEYRFHIRCPTCCSEIVYRTDRENNDYVVESGAKRSFEAYTTAIRQAIKESVQEKEELEKNPIKALEKRTEESMNEFKRSNTIQDLMERSRNDPPREQLIDNALARLRQEREATQLAQAQVDQQLHDRPQIDDDSSQRQPSIDFAAMDDLLRAARTTNAHFAHRENLLKQMLQRKRRIDGQQQQSHEATGQTQTGGDCCDDASAAKRCSGEGHSSVMANESSDNPLGLDYDSSSTDE